MIRIAWALIAIALVGGCAEQGFRGKHTIPVSAKAGEKHIVGMLVEFSDPTCAKGTECALEYRLYNSDFTEYAVAQGTFEPTDLNRVIEAVGSYDNEVLSVRKYRRRSAANYQRLVDQSADEYMLRRYGCILAWDRDYSWRYDKNKNRTIVNTRLTHPAGGVSAPILLLEFDGFTGLFRSEEKINITGELCK